MSEWADWTKREFRGAYEGVSPRRSVHAPGPVSGEVQQVMRRYRVGAERACTLTLVHKTWVRLSGFETNRLKQNPPLAAP